MGTLHGLTYAGYMAICNTILTAIYIAPNTIFSTYLQKRYHTLRPDEQFTPLKHAALSFTAGVLIAIPLYFFAQSIINLLFGTQYQEAANIFKVMCLAIPIRFLITSIGAAILSESVVKYKILAAGLGLIIQVFLFISLSSMGSTGIGISVIVSEIIVATLYLTIYMKPLTK
jgi:O-antigen/teichoic acid export membrane protein